jgi:hypothetical protein
MVKEGRRSSIKEGENDNNGDGKGVIGENE